MATIFSSGMVGQSIGWLKILGFHFFIKLELFDFEGFWGIVTGFLGLNRAGINIIH